MHNNPDVSAEGTVGSWLLIIFAAVTAQDLAYYLACGVSVGAMLINGDRYWAALKRYWNRIKGEK
jgi:hypothetical protein